jgi:hypothetical protein
MACGYQICLHSGAPAPVFHFKRLNLEINFHNTRFLRNRKQCAAITKKSIAHFSYGSTRSFLLDSRKPLNTQREQHFLMVKHWCVHKSLSINPIKHKQSTNQDDPETHLKNPYRTAQETHSFSVTRTSKLMLSKDAINPCSQNCTENIHTLCGRNVEV